MSIFEPQFMRFAFAAGVIVGILAPAVGFFLVQRRMSLIGDGIGHTAFAGVAAGYLLGISPVATALAASVSGAVAIEWLRSHRRAAGDQALALLFYTGIAGGVVLVSAAGALNAGVFAFLFGSILTVSTQDLVLVGVLGAIALAVIGTLYRGFLACALDEEGARVAGVPVAALNVLIAALAGVTIAVSMRIVGILLIAALMVLPVLAASRIARSVRETLLLAMALGVAAVFAGLYASFYFDLAPGGSIVLAAAASFVGVLTLDAVRSFSRSALD
jgi:zinc transport system permease protein